MARPIIKQTSAFKVFKYFFGDTWQKEDLLIIGVRNGKNKINIFDDDAFVWSNKLQTGKTFNWNADPSAYASAGSATSILRTGVHPYTMSYHHKWNNAKRYVALRPRTPGESLPVWRSVGGKMKPSTGVAINIHAGGNLTTGSLGCQTMPASQFGEFITFIGQTLGVKVPLGKQPKPDKRFLAGIGKIQYILLTQQDFDYILNLHEDSFDSMADLKYQMAHFVNIPKIERAVEIPAFPPSNAAQVMSELQSDEDKYIANSEEPDEEHLATDEDIEEAQNKEAEVSSSMFKPSDLTGSIIGSIIGASPVDSIVDKIDEVKDAVSDSSDKLVDGVQQAADNAGSKMEQTADKIINVGSDAVKTPIDDAPFMQYLPDITGLKRWYYKVIGLGILGNIGAWYGDLPMWQKYAVAGILVASILGLLYMVNKHKTWFFGFMEKLTDYRADPEKNSPIPTTEMPTLEAQVPARLKSIERAKRLAVQLKSGTEASPDRGFLSNWIGW